MTTGGRIHWSNLKTIQGLWWGLARKWMMVPKISIEILNDQKGNFKCRLFSIAPWWMFVIVWRWELRNVICHLSLTRGSCTWHFLLSFHRVLLCGIARVSAHDCEIEFNSHTATGGRLLSACWGEESGVKYREITIIMFFLSTQAQYPADRIRKIPVFIAQELANRRIEGIYMDIKGVFLLCQYLKYCWATVLFGLSLIVWFGKSTKVLRKVLLFMEAMKMNFNFQVPLASLLAALRTFLHFYCFPQVTRKA